MPTVTHEHQIAGRVTFDGRIANNDICAKCEEVWPCDFTQARMQRDALRTALTAAQATIAQRDAQVAELTAALTEAAWLMSNTPTDRPFSQEDVDADNEWYERADLWSERFDALMARTPAAPEGETDAQA